MKTEHGDGLAHGVFRARPRGDGVDEAELLGGHGVLRPPARDHGERGLEAEQPGQALGPAGAWQQAEAHLGQPRRALGPATR